jgi:hypothetical protein
MDQPPLFVESIYDALRSIVQHCGGAKSIGARLWPQKSVDDARRQLLDCINPERSEKLDPEQMILLLRLARECEYHVAKHYLDAETGYLPSIPADPGEEQARLVQVIENAGRELNRAVTALEKLREHKPLQRVA